LQATMFNRPMTSARNRIIAPNSLSAQSSARPHH
jgi:hypothetical protein